MDASDKFLGLLKIALTTLSQILEIGTLTEVGKIVEEILSYMRSTFSLEPATTVECVQQLLKCLFGTNLTASMSDSVVANEDDTDVEKEVSRSVWWVNDALKLR